MVFFTKRRKERERAEARERGEQVDYLVEEAPSEFRMQLWYALEDADNTCPGLIKTLYRGLLVEYGWPHLCSASIPYRKDLLVFVAEGSQTGHVMDVIDAAVDLLISDRDWRKQLAHEYFVKAMRSRLREHQLAYDVVGNKVVERRSEILHSEVVSPALTLLHGRARFERAEIQFRDALRELADRKWGDAITDANATVESVLRTLVGYSQGQLPDLLKAARTKGLFGDKQDARMKKFLTGLATLADIRNEEGDAHGNSSDEPTAWLAVHWAGALVVYLVQQSEYRGV